MTLLDDGDDDEKFMVLIFLRDDDDDDDDSLLLERKTAFLPSIIGLLMIPAEDAFALVSSSNNVSSSTAVVAIGTMFWKDNFIVFGLEFRLIDWCVC